MSLLKRVITHEYQHKINTKIGNNILCVDITELPVFFSGFATRSSFCGISPSLGSAN